MVNSRDEILRKRWEKIENFYKEVVVNPYWKFLTPMVDFVRQIARTSEAQEVYPLTSHHALCLSSHSEYNPDLPFFAFCVEPEGGFKFEFFQAVGDLVDSQEVLPTEAIDLFKEYTKRLRLATIATPRPTPYEEHLLQLEREFYNILGAERLNQPCRKEGCFRGAISHSVFCRVHHYEMVRKRKCPFED